jgi:hypothetical protein
MDLFVLLFVIAIIGFVAYALITWVKMPPPFPTIIIAVAVIAVLILLWNVFGGYFPHVPVGRHPQ